jgi:hypothetical protein
MPRLLEANFAGYKNLETCSNVIYELRNLSNQGRGAQQCSARPFCRRSRSCSETVTNSIGSFRWCISENEIRRPILTNTLLIQPRRIFTNARSFCSSCCWTPHEKCVRNGELAACSSGLVVWFHFRKCTSGKIWSSLWAIRWSSESVGKTAAPSTRRFCDARLFLSLDSRGSTVHVFVFNMSSDFCTSQNWLRVAVESRRWYWASQTVLRKHAAATLLKLI